MAVGSCGRFPSALGFRAKRASVTRRLQSRLRLNWGCLEMTPRFAHCLQQLVTETVHCNDLQMGEEGQHVPTSLGSEGLLLILFAKVFVNISFSKRYTLESKLDHSA
jgi:hypothetical protein